MPGPDVDIREATAADAPQRSPRSMATHVLHGFGTFEEEPPAASEIERRLTSVLKAGFPYLVATLETRVVGFAYATQFRPRAAYRHAVKIASTSRPRRARRGVGRALLSAVIEVCERLGKRQMIAVIGDSGNAGSLGLHASLGFKQIGVGQSVGFKQGRWVDIVWMQRPLNGGDASAPARD